MGKLEDGFCHLPDHHVEPVEHFDDDKVDRDLGWHERGDPIQAELERHESSRRDAATATRVILTHILQSKSVKNYLIAYCYILGVFEDEGKSLRDVASENRLTVQALSKIVTEISTSWGVPPVSGMKSVEARTKYGKTNSWRTKEKSSKAKSRRLSRRTSN